MFQSKAFKLVFIGVLSSISFILMVLNFPLPGLPPYLKVDFSDIPAIIALIMFGPVAGIIVEAIKNILHFFIQSSATGVPIDQAANFIAGVFLIIPFSFIFKKMRSLKGAVIGLVVGTIFMTVGMALLNYFVILPAYTYFLNMPQMQSHDVKLLIITGILPFNLIKGLLVTTLFYFLYHKLIRPMEYKLHRKIPA
ncbi:ECF transporter S component [Bacillus sp. FJAT-47783]|uniref:ECF transporter S component n=1 Tax=Bacillus sp. FJAT-47783 TaxID=2922712 RepID=UPI001FADAD22|nr:ECF transporter S component [Bacillus sp. FJAT-47783]